MQKYVNYQVLFKAQGLNLTQSQMNETLISTSIALQVGGKCMMFQSITKSKQIIAEKFVENVSGTVSVPEMTKIINQSYLELKNLHLKTVEWHGSIKFGLKLSSGDSCTAGSYYKTNNSHTFVPEKNITKVECIINKNESCIDQINFYSGDELLVKVGLQDWFVKNDSGRVESFEIAGDERLIGAELVYIVNNEKDHFKGVTWIKMKVRI